MFSLAVSRAGAATGMRRLPRVTQTAVLLRRPLGRPPKGLSARAFGGRSSNSGGRKGPEPPAEKEVAVEAETVEAKTAAAASSTSSTAKTGPDGKEKPAFFALPLYRKPTFPGFYQVVQVGEQEVLDFLTSLRKNGQGEYIAGFMTKKELEQGSEEAGQTGSSSVPPGTLAPSSQNLRRDSGRVNSVDELEEVGTVLQVINMTPHPNVAGGQVVVMPHRRIRRKRTVSHASPNVPLPAVAVEYLEEPEVPKEDQKLRAVHQEIVATMKELLKTSHLYKDQFEQVIRFYDLENPVKLADLVAGMSFANRTELQEVLQETDLFQRLEKVLYIVKKDLEATKLQSEMKTQIEENISKTQRKHMLMEQMKQIQKELGIQKDNKETLIEQYREAVKDKTLPEEANKVLEAELQKLQTLEPSSSEFNVCRTYLDWLTPLPWGETTKDNADICKAEEILNEDHYGLEDVKERILEHIAVTFLKGSVQGKIMCLVGPPGVGKTSIGKSIARALDRKFYHFSVGGLHDVAELRGHRRTYVGAMPGKLIQCLKITKSSNPVVLIDEIDKLGRDMRGDPASALLEILDPEQNNSFRDHYLDVPVDLSQVLFVCTANILDTIPGPLLDRFEVIRIAGYVHEEKMAITQKYLLPQIMESTGVGKENVDLDEVVVSKIITDYAREAGVRQLKKLLEKVSRKVALNMVRHKGKEGEQMEKESITTENLTKYIGQPLHLSERLYPFGPPVGVVMGLAWTSLGGAHLFIEATGRLPLRALDTSDDTEKEEGKRRGGGMGGPMKVTGQLGKVMTESSDISLTYARLFVRELSSKSSFLEDAHIHLNVPEGATPKDGPSAGVTMTSALLSLALGEPVKSDMAMTGELTITGKVLRVGGIKEKVIAARRENITTLILPRQNEADFSELKEYLRTGITAHFVDHYDDVYRLAFDTEAVPQLSRPSLGQSMVTIEPPTEKAEAEKEDSSSQGASEVPTPLTPEPLPSATDIAAGARRGASGALVDERD
jgi:Lon-like ATP-dependent protease